MAETVSPIPLFDSLSADEQRWIVEHSSALELHPGDYLFREGDRDERFYFVLDGELQITHIVNGVEQVLGNHVRGDMGGELGLLRGTARSGSARAIVPTHLLLFNRNSFQEIFTAVPALGMRILRTAAARLSGNASRTTRDEKLAALGKFSAGLAHELNNPASAARRAAQSFQDLLPGYLQRSVRLGLLGLNAAQLEQLLTAEKHFAERAQELSALSPMEQSDREEAFIAWLKPLTIERPYDVASVYISNGLSVAEVEQLLRGFPESAWSDVIIWLCDALDARSLLCEIDDSTTRISDLVHTVKEYTYMDQGKFQQVDIHKSLDTTVKILGHKVGSIRIIREYDRELPPISANGGELNQVWTNLIDNAIDALKDIPDGYIRLITRAESDFVMVAIADNGPGIPPEVMSHMFEPFFTTKDVGEGTGLGLDIAFRIIAQHQGTIEAQSEPGNTQFIIRLPVQPKASAEG